MPIIEKNSLHRIAVSLLVIGAIAVSSSSYAASRKVNKNALDPEPTEKDRYHLTLIPVQFRTPIDRSIFSPNVVGQYCSQTDYSAWMHPIASEAELESRDKFLAKKLGRPFYFAENGRDNFIGLASDAKEILCVIAVVNGGKGEGSPPIQFSKTFFSELLVNKDINFQVLGIAMRFWRATSQDAETARAILSHPNNDVFLTTELVQSLFAAGFPVSVRAEVLGDFLGSKIYSQNSKAFETVLVDSITNIKPSEEGPYPTVDFLVGKMGVVFSPESLLRLANKIVSTIDPSRAYDKLYDELSGKTSIENRADILLSFLYSDAKLSNSGADFKSVWSEVNNVTYANLIDFILDYTSAIKRVDSNWIYQTVLSEIPQARFKERQARVVINLAADKLTLPVSERLDWFYAFFSRAKAFPGLIKDALPVSYALVRQAPASELRIARSINDVIQSFWSDPAVFDGYIGLFDFLTDPSLKVEMTESLLKNFSLDEDFLSRRANDAIAVKSELSYRVILGILTQSKVSSNILRNLVLGVYGGHGPLTSDEVTLLGAIEVHALATPEIKDLIRQARGRRH